MIVLDASALVEVLVGGARSAWVRDAMGDHEVRAPAHQPGEVLSALARLVRDGSLTSSGARAAAGDLGALPQSLVLPTARHLSRALELDGRFRSWRRPAESVLPSRSIQHDMITSRADQLHGAPGLHMTERRERAAASDRTVVRPSRVRAFALLPS